MQTLIDGLTHRPLLSLAVAAMLSGIALFYLVMQRTRKHRLQQLENNNGVLQGK